MPEVASHRRAEAHAHRHEVVDLGRRGAQVADPAAGPGLGVEAGDVGRGLLAPVGHGHVHVLRRRRPASPRSSPIRLTRSAGRSGRTRSLGPLHPEQLALGGPVQRDDGAGGSGPPAGPCPRKARESAAPSGRRSGCRPRSACTAESPRRSGTTCACRDFSGSCFQAGSIASAPAPSRSPGRSFRL